MGSIKLGEKLGLLAALGGAAVALISAVWGHYLDLFGGFLVLVLGVLVVLVGRSRRSAGK